MDNLIIWKDNPYRKPLVLQGVKHSGKTYLLREFGKAYFKDIIYVDFSIDKQITDLFGQDNNPERLLKDISIYYERDIKPGETLLIFDEIQFCKPALAAMQSLSSVAEQYHIIAAGSYLSTSLPHGAVIPLDCVEILTLYPMNFYEFLLAQSPMLANHLRESDIKSQSYKTFYKQLIEKYRDFQIIGGMPQVVNDWIEHKSIENVRNLQTQIILSFENDFAIHSPVKLLPKIIAVWNAIPIQLSKTNRKFMFSKVKKTWRGKDLDDAVYWLVRSGLVYKVTHIEKPEVPVSGFADPAFFKLYLCDVGLLHRIGGFPHAMILNSADNTDVKGAIAENIVCCELKRIFEQELYYWSAEHPGKAEVEFIVQDGDDLIPVEVKAGSAGRARSLLQYNMRFNPKKFVLTGLDNDKDNVLPLYCFWKLREWLEI